MTKFGSVLCVGNFDGVHVGHQSVFETLRREAHRLGERSIVLTFDPHPASVLRNEAPPLLTLPATRAKMIRACGISEVSLLPFTKDFAARSAENFVQEVLLKQFQMKTLCIGPDTHFGRKREGTPERIKDMGKSLGFRVLTIDPVQVKGLPVSSSRIRKTIFEGRMDEILGLLGRRYGIRGVVGTGSSRGRSLGFPTANIEGIETILPARGVYSTWIQLERGVYPSVTNVGIRPTFESTQELKVETHIFDFVGNLVGQRVGILWNSWIREEKKFPSTQALSAQIAKDCIMARQALERAGNISTLESIAIDNRL